MSFISEAAQAHRNAQPERSISVLSQRGIEKWLAVYTTARHEKRVADHFSVREIEYFLPLYETQRRWKDGSKVKLHLPLFPNYIFVHADPRARGRILEVPGVVSLVGNTHEATPIAESVIESLRAGVGLRDIEPHPYLVVGNRARIRTGALAGMEGVLVRKSNQFRVVLTIAEIMKSVSVEIDAADLELLGPAH